MSTVDPVSNTSVPPVTNTDTDQDTNSNSSSEEASVLSSTNTSSYKSSVRKASNLLGGLTQAQAQQLQDQYDRQQAFEKMYNQEEIQDFQLEIQNMNNNKDQNKSQ